MHCPVFLREAHQPPVPLRTLRLCASALKPTLRLRGAAHHFGAYVAAVMQQLADYPEWMRQEAAIRAEKSGTFLAEPERASLGWGGPWRFVQSLANLVICLRESLRVK